TVMSAQSVRGIVNFVVDGRHDFGQGLITYADQQVVNPWVTLMDAHRVADDMGKMRFQLQYLNQALFSWKGSYMVCRVKAELEVSYDHGLDGSVAEDCYFAMRALMGRHTFGWIEGPMWEKSPFTIWDYIEQRKRWMQGIWLVVHSPNIPWSCKMLRAMSFYGYMTMALPKLLSLFLYFMPQYSISWVSVLQAFMDANTNYMFIFGTYKMFNVRKVGVKRYVMLMFGSLFAPTVYLIADTIAILYGLFSNKYKFYLVNKHV
ncbi:unnamed protein product, partial [Medioppia subpectinata]